MATEQRLDAAKGIDVTSFKIVSEWVESSFAEAFAGAVPELHIDYHVETQDLVTRAAWKHLSVAEQICIKRQAVVLPAIGISLAGIPRDSFVSSSTWDRFRDDELLTVPLSLYLFASRHIFLHSISESSFHLRELDNEGPFHAYVAILNDESLDDLCRTLWLIPKRDGRECSARDE